MGSLGLSSSRWAELSAEPQSVTAHVPAPGLKTSFAIFSGVHLPTDHGHHARAPKALTTQCHGRLSEQEWQREGIKLPGTVSVGGRSEAPPQDKHPQCVSQVRASAKLLNRSGEATQSEDGDTSADAAQQLWRGRRGAGDQGTISKILLGSYCLINLLRGFPWVLSKVEKRGIMRLMLSVHQSSPKPDSPGPCRGLCRKTWWAGIWRFTKSWDRRRGALG